MVTIPVPLDAGAGPIPSVSVTSRQLVLLRWDVVSISACWHGTSRSNDEDGDGDNGDGGDDYGDRGDGDDNGDGDGDGHNLNQLHDRVEVLPRTLSGMNKRMQRHVASTVYSILR